MNALLERHRPYVIGDDGGLYCGCDPNSLDVPWLDHYLATPEGKALAALVEAALAWGAGEFYFDAGSPESDRLIEAAEAYIEATR